jgi:hypothetical protein
MSHFAKIENGIVIDVIVAEQDFINSGAVGDPSLWVQTSFNTRGGVHYGQDGQPDGGIALRKNYAIIGGTYDSVIDAFISIKPYASWVLNTETCLWEAPIPKPAKFNTDTLIIYYVWNENTISWDEKSAPLNTSNNIG